MSLLRTSSGFCSWSELWVPFYCFGFNEMCQGIALYTSTNHARFSSLPWSKTEPDWWLVLSSFSPKAFPGRYKNFTEIHPRFGKNYEFLYGVTGPALVFVLWVPNCEWHFIASGSMRCAKVLPHTREPIMLASQVYLEVKRSQTGGVRFFESQGISRYY